MKRIDELLWAWVICIAAVPAAYAGSSGPISGATGVPEGGGFAAETTCNSCHADSALNPDDQGRIELIGVPSTYVPSCGYEISIRLSHPEATRWGFEVTAIDAASYKMAGDLTTLPNDKTTQRVAGGVGDRVYVTHGTIGRATGAGKRGSFEWKFVWTAPPGDVGDVLFYGAGNAANGDGSNFGDRIFTASPKPVAISKAPGKKKTACPAAGAGSNTK